MTNFKKYSSLIVTALMLSACGGGSDNSEATASHILDGKWTLGCVYDASSNIAISTIVTISGSSYTNDASYYNTSDCSGLASTKSKILGNIDYQGQTTTSVCVAENTNIVYQSMSINGTQLTSEELQTILLNSSIPNPNHNIACVDSNKLWFGEYINGKDGSTSDRRPTTIDSSIFGTRI
jgi:hypothetical protein